MFIKNFFEEFLKINRNEFEIEASISGSRLAEQVKEAISKKYKLPLERQKIFIVKNKPILSLTHPNADSQNSIIKIPEQFEELGATQEDFNCFYGRCRDLATTEASMFPYIQQQKNEGVVFEGIEKDGLENTDSYVNRIDDKHKDMIVNNLEAYVRSFLEFPDD